MSWHSLQNNFRKTSERRGAVYAILNNDTRPRHPYHRGSPRLKILPPCALLALTASTAIASPATFVTALPVARDQLLVRFNFQPTFATQNFTGVQLPVNIGYGLTSRWALFLNLNQGFGSLTQTTPQGRSDLSSSG